MIVHFRWDHTVCKGVRPDHLFGLCCTREKTIDLLSLYYNILTKQKSSSACVKRISYQLICHTRKMSQTDRKGIQITLNIKPKIINSDESRLKIYIFQSGIKIAATFQNKDFFNGLTHTILRLRVVMGKKDPHNFLRPWRILDWLLTVHLGAARTLAFVWGRNVGNYLCLL